LDWNSWTATATPFMSVRMTVFHLDVSSTDPPSSTFRHLLQPSMPSHPCFLNIPRPISSNRRSTIVETMFRDVWIPGLRLASTLGPAQDGGYAVRFHISAQPMLWWLWFAFEPPIEKMPHPSCFVVSLIASQSSKTPCRG
jgi:hypothetical protein